MAKFEEADPRWKVKDLGDKGTNVNGWHWTENDMFPWFKDKFGEMFDDKMVIENSTDGPSGLLCSFKCWKLDKCTGEASITRRKGNKVIVLYEIEAKIKWECTLKNAAGETVASSKGAFEMPCIDTVEDIDKFEMQVKFNKQEKEQQAPNDYARVQGQARVRQMIVDAILLLKEQAGQTAAQNTATNEAASAKAAAGAPAATAPAKAASSSGNSRSIEVSTTFAAPAKEVFECFTVPQKCMAFTQSRCQVGTSVGEPLMMFDGAVTGKLIECEPDQKLVYEWRQVHHCLCLCLYLYLCLFLSVCLVVGLSASLRACLLMYLPTKCRWCQWRRLLPCRGFWCLARTPPPLAIAARVAKVLLYFQSR